jgi:hypothetical protein
VRFLADENVPLALIARLRSLGHDVLWVAETAPGIDDAEVLRLARTDTRVCITFDKDLGEIAAQQPDLAVTGVILLRVPMPTPAEAAALAETIGAQPDWPGHLSIVEPGRRRMRPLRPRS